MTEAQCVQCRRRPAVRDWRPFCSERCKMLDLSRWLDGSYRVAGEPVDVSHEEESEPSDTAADTDER